MESVPKSTIFDLKMMVKSGLEKIFLKFFHAGNYFLLLRKSVQNLKFSNKNRPSSLVEGGISKKKFWTTFHHHFYAKNGIFGYRFHFEGKNNV